MKAAIPVVACPSCGSHSVVYSCEPKCCFNHVCGDCHCTFELQTRALGGELPEVEAPERPLEACDPTAECARCHSLTVYQVGDRYVCLSCSALLVVEYTEISPA